jgi:hypothetical protein
MTKEEKELLLKDLCARLPYKVICDCLHDYHTEASAVDAEDLTVYYPYCDEWESIEHCKPYLRPMSSMTEEESQELHSICPHSTFNKTNVSGWIVGIDGSEYGRIARINEISKLIDWLNKNMFDYRELIEKGLALEATKGMYNN